MSAELARHRNTLLSRRLSQSGSRYIGVEGIDSVTPNGAENSGDPSSLYDMLVGLRDYVDTLSTINLAPPWDSVETYALNRIVQLSGVLYISLQAANLNKNPATETAWWEETMVATILENIITAINEGRAP